MYGVYSVSIGGGMGGFNADIPYQNFHTMAIKTDDSLWAWGSNNRGQLGDGTNYDRLAPVKIMDNAVAVSAGRRHTLAVCIQGIVWAWGANQYGQLGDGSTEDKNFPVQVIFDSRLNYP